MYLEPTAIWPRHSRPEARAALEGARAAGWWFRPSQGHIFGLLRCMPPERDPTGAACKVPIFSTSGAKDGSNTAQAIRDAVRRCPHDRDQLDAEEPNPEVAARLAGGKLAEIARLVDAAEGLVQKDRALQAASEMIDRAAGWLIDDSDAPVDDLERQAEELERLANTADTVAFSAAAQVGVADPWPPDEGASELVALARAGLDDVAVLVATAAGSGDERKLGLKRDKLVSRLDRLTTQLSAEP